MTPRRDHGHAEQTAAGETRTAMEVFRLAADLERGGYHVAHVDPHVDAGCLLEAYGVGSDGSNVILRRSPRGGVSVNQFAFESLADALMVATAAFIRSDARDADVGGEAT